MSDLLKYSGFEELVASCQLNEQQVCQYEKIPCDRLFTSMRTMVKAGKSNRGDLEEQFRCFMKAGELSSIMMKRPDFDSWEEFPKRTFYSELEKMMDELSNIQATLKSKYESVRVRQDTAEKKAEAEKKANMPKVAMHLIRPLITPRDLVKKVETEDPKKSAVIFDFRRDQTDTIHYNRSEMITVIQVPYSCIDSSLTFPTLRSSVPVNQRALLHRLSNYDFVVLMDDETPEMAGNDPAPQKKVHFLFRALMQFNTQDYRPRGRPLFMEGGFKMWKAQYGVYTTNEQPATPRAVPTDRIDEMIHNIKYPDLMARDTPTLEPKRPPVLPSEPYYEPPPPEKEQQRPGFGVYPSVAQRPTIPPPSQPSHLERPTGPMFSKPPPQMPPMAPPQIAPMAPPAKPMPPAPQYPIFPDRSQKPSTMPERPALLRKKDPSPTRPTAGGGAGVNGRPPLLDRSCKPFQQGMSRENEIQLLSIYDQLKMAIERSSRRANSPTPGATGLFNLGNTCFMSATLQCLFQTPGLPEVFTKKAFLSKVNVDSRMGSKGIVSSGFTALMDSIWSGAYDAIKPARFLQLFADEVSNILSDGKQHDASEFQIFLLDALHEDTNQAKRIGFEQNYRGGPGIAKEAVHFMQQQKMFSSSPVNRLFGGVVVSEIRCSTCGETSATFEENTLVSVELTSTSQCTLDSCLQSHFSETTLDGDSCWNCPKCKQLRVSTRRSKLWALPNIMVIHLKRFALFNGEFEKNLAAVTFDANRFETRPYLHERAPTERSTYKLYATTIHNGRLNSGHYTAVASHLTSGKWLRFDDESVRNIDRYSVDPSLAYILFYKRC